MNITLQRIEELCHAQNIKPVKLCPAIGVTIATYYAWYKNDTLPNTKSIRNMARLFNVSSDYLLGLSDVSNAQATSLPMELRMLLAAANGLSIEDIVDVIGYIDTVKRRKYEEA